MFKTSQQEFESQERIHMDYKSIEMDLHQEREVHEAKLRAIEEKIIGVDSHKQELIYKLELKDLEIRKLQKTISELKSVIEREKANYVILINEKSSLSQEIEHGNSKAK